MWCYALEPDPQKGSVTHWAPQSLCKWWSWDLNPGLSDLKAWAGLWRTSKGIGYGSQGLKGARQVRSLRTKISGSTEEGGEAAPRRPPGEVPSRQGPA